MQTVNSFMHPRRAIPKALDLGIEYWGNPEQTGH